MLKKVPDLIHYYLNNNDSKIKYISTSYYHRLQDTVIETTKQIGITKDNVTVITCNFENYKKLKKSNISVYYFYDLIDFDDLDVFLNKDYIFNTPVIFIDTVNSIDYKIIKKLCLLNMKSIIFVFYDKFIPGIMNTIDSNNFFFEKFNDSIIEKPQNDSSVMNSNISQLLNKIRAKDNLDKIFFTNNEAVSMVNISSLSPSDFNITKPIITPHISIVQKFNMKIRNHYGLIDTSDPIRPIVDEYMVLYQIAECMDEFGNMHILPCGYRFKILDIQDTFNNNHYKVFFEYTNSDLEVLNVSLIISKTFIENMYYSNDYTEHDNAYKAYFGYVLLDVLSYHNTFEEGYVIYDETKIFDLHALYTSCLPIKKNLVVFYNLSNPITI